MKSIKLQSGVTPSVYDELGLDKSDSVIVTNNTTSVVYILQSDTPTNWELAYPLWPAQSCLVHGNTKDAFLKGSSNGMVLIQPLNSTITPFTGAELSQDLYTSKNEGFRRLRVDIAQTGFFEGREFRFFKELNIAANGTYIVKCIVNTNTILFDLNMYIDAGKVKLSVYQGGAETVPSVAALPVIPKNRMTYAPVINPTNQILGGGSGFSGGILTDVVRIFSAGSTAQQSTIGGQISSERGVAPGTYYFVFQNLANEAATGVFKGYFEERYVDQHGN